MNLAVALAEAARRESKLPDINEINALVCPEMNIAHFGTDLMQYVRAASHLMILFHKACP